MGMQATGGGLAAAITFRCAAILIVSVLVAACDHGSLLVGDNRSGEELIARATGTEDDSEGGLGPAEVVVVLPANTRLAIAELPFAGGFRVQRVDILTADCTPLGTLRVRAGEGTLVEIAEDLAVRLRNEYPESAKRAETTDRCRATPSASQSTASPSP